MTEVAQMVERAGYRPEWFNVYKRVEVDLTTHDAGGITRKDLDLVREAAGNSR